MTTSIFPALIYPHKATLLAQEIFQWIPPPLRPKKKSGKHTCYTCRPDLNIKKLAVAFSVFASKTTLEVLTPSPLYDLWGGGHSKNLKMELHKPLSDIQNLTKFRKILRRETKDTHFFPKHTRSSLYLKVYEGWGAHPLREKFFTQYLYPYGHFGFRLKIKSFGRGPLSCLTRLEPFQ